MSPGAVAAAIDPEARSAQQESAPLPLPMTSQIGVDLRGVHPKRALATRAFRVDG